MLYGYWICSLYSKRLSSKSSLWSLFIVIRKIIYIKFGLYFFQKNFFYLYSSSYYYYCWWYLGFFSSYISLKKKKKKIRKEKRKNFYIYPSYNGAFSSSFISLFSYYICYYYYYCDYYYYCAISLNISSKLWSIIGFGCSCSASSSSSSLTVIGLLDDTNFA